MNQIRVFRRIQFRLKAMKFTLGFVFALAFVGCSSTSSSGPTAPSAAVLPAGPTPTVTGLSVNVGSTDGGTRIKIIGTDLLRGASVTFGNAKVFSNSNDPRDAPNTSLLITTPAHAAGVVDVIVTNPNGQAVRASAGYEFAEPQSFDFNGNWSGVTVDGSIGDSPTFFGRPDGKALGSNSRRFCYQG
jgi:hypothetical protein